MTMKTNAIKDSSILLEIETGIVREWEPLKNLQKAATIETEGK